MTSFLADQGPRWFTIPPHRPFAEDLACGILAALQDGGPEALADAVLLTPTRRAGREVAAAFLAAGAGPAALLPRIQPLGDLDEGEPPFEPADIALGLPPAISPWRRRFELTRMVKAHEGRLKRSLDAAGALALADALGAFLDACHIQERTSPDPLDGLGEDFADHWVRSADFLKIALVDWPRRLADLGLLDVAERRVKLIRRLAETWDKRPPPGVLIAAGSTGTAPASADMLVAIAKAPQGVVVLPGLDHQLAQDAWAAVDDQHPQASLKGLLTQAMLTREDVRVWPQSLAPSARGRWRQSLISEALRPAGETHDWLKQIERLQEEGRKEGVDPVAEGLKGLTSITAKAEDEAAAVCAVLIRETLEIEGATVALITPDLALSRRVSARLSRWGIEAETSAGTPLAGYPVAVLARLAAATAVDPTDPVTLLGLLKSPLTRLGLATGPYLGGRDRLEAKALRGARTRTIEDLRKRTEEAPAAADLLERLEAALDPLLAIFAEGPAEVSGVARALAEALEALAKGPGRAGSGRLWAGPAGDCSSRLIAALMSESEGLPPADAPGFLTLLDALLAGESVRSAAVAHPRVRILGAIEARLIRADRLILAGLEETVWPASAPVDPFLSRPMRKALELPTPERRIGLSAHDFAQAANAPDVVLVHSERRGGSPAVASRWLWRLQTLVSAVKVQLPTRPEVLAWARGLDAPLADPPPALQTAGQPAPCPPVEVRPTELAVTRVESLVRDPYAVYAQYILRLKALDRPDEPVEARRRGTAIHKALEDFARLAPEEQTPEVFAELMIGILEREGAAPTALARERPLALRAGQWVVNYEAERRALGAHPLLEQQGRLILDIDGEPFTLTAKADRIEAVNGVAHIIDFKTGAPPSARQVKSGFSPQLTLTAAILAGGGFEDLGPMAAGDLAYIRLTGREPPGIVTTVAGADADDASADLARLAEEGLIELVRRYRNPNTPYRSRTAPQWAESPGETYDQLARVREWSTADEEEAF